MENSTSEMPQQIAQVHVDDDEEGEPHDAEADENEDDYLNDLLPDPVKQTTEGLDVADNTKEDDAVPRHDDEEGADENEDNCLNDVEPDLVQQTTEGKEISDNVEVEDTPSSDDEDSADENEEDYLNEIVYALANFKATASEQMSLVKGQDVKVLLKTSEHWWWAEVGGAKGYVPVNHLTPRSYQELCWQDDEYFGNYGSLKLHHEMLSDKTRTLAYLQAIKDNAHYLKDKVVLDVGCGTGVLSMLCAKHGQCKKVYAVDACDIVDYTQNLVEHNGLDGVVTVMHAYVEDIQLDEPVDVIISEWMGTFLLFEMMLESVILARNLHLSSNGVVWPSTAHIFLVPCSAETMYAEKMAFWDDVFELDFSPVRNLAMSEFLSTPFHNYELPKVDILVASPTKIFSLSIKTLTVEELETMTTNFDLIISKDGSFHGFCAWFQVDFEGLGPDVRSVFLNTGPDCELTHWKQTLFMLDEPVNVSRNDQISGSVTITRNPNYRRHIRVNFTFSISRVCFVDGEDKSSTDVEKTFLLWR